MPFLVVINVKNFVIHVLGLLNSYTSGYGERKGTAWEEEENKRRIMNDGEVWYVLRESRWGSKVAGTLTVGPNR